VEVHSEALLGKQRSSRSTFKKVTSLTTMQAVLGNVSGPRCCHEPDCHKPTSLQPGTAQLAFARPSASSTGRQLSWLGM